MAPLRDVYACVEGADIRQYLGKKFRKCYS